MSNEVDISIISTPDAIFEEYLEGETELHLDSTIVGQTAKIMKNAYVSTLLAQEKYKQVIRLLGCPFQHDKHASEVLILMCNNGSVSSYQVAVLFSKGADLNGLCDTGTGKHVFHILAERHCHAAVKYLLAAGANSSVVDTEGQTPLIAASKPVDHNSGISKSTQLKTVKSILYKIYSGIDLKDIHSCTALDYACLNNNVWVVKALLKAGASVLESIICIKLTADRREGTLLSQYYLDYNSSELWIQSQLLRYSAEKVCRGLVQYRWRLELRTSSATRAVRTAEEDRIDLILRDPTQYQLSADDTQVADMSSELGQEGEGGGVGASKEKTSAELRQERRQKRKAEKHSIKSAKEQNMIAQEQEAKRMEFMKKVEKEYSVSFRGLFP